MKASALLTSMLVVLAIGTGVAEAGRDKAGGASGSRPTATVKDNPGARQRWREEWYNESYGLSGPQAKQKLYRDGLWTPEYLRFMAEAAKRERIVNRAKMPPSSMSSVVLDSRMPMLARAPGTSLNRDLRWENIGPTRADRQTNGGITLNVMDAGRVRNILTDPANPNTLYVAFSGGGLWRSLDGGAFWQAMTETLGSLSVGAVAMDPNNASTLYLGLGDPFDGTGLGVVKMTERGEKWAEPVLLGDSTNIRDILVPPSNSNIVLVATNRGLYRSTDAGRTFARVTIDAANATVPGIWSLAQGSPTVTVVNGANTNTHTIVLTLEAAPGATGTASRMGQVWRSTDSGATWTRANGITHANGINRISLASAPSNRNTMYAMAAETNGGTADLANIFRSTDGGANWAAIATDATGAYLQYTNPVAGQAAHSSIERLLGGQGFYNHMILIDPNDANTVYFGGQLQMVRARPVNNVFQFTRMTDWLAQFGLPYVHADFHAGHFARNPNQSPTNPNDDWFLYAGTDGGIFRSNDGGTTFTHALNEGLSTHKVYNVCSSPNNAARVLAGLQDNGTRLRVLDAAGNGTSVFNQVIGGDGFGCDVNRANANQMIGSVQYLSPRRSTDGGATFALSCTGITECGDDAAAPFRTIITPWRGDATGNTLYTYSHARVYRTTNYGTGWAALGSTGLPAATDASGNRTLFIRGVAAARTSGAAVNDDSVIGVITNGGGIFLTTSRGAQTVVGGATVNGWARAGALPSHDSSLSSITFDPTDRNIIYVTSVAPSTTAAHVWRSTDFGRNWAIIDGTGTVNGNGFPRGIPVNSITVDHTVRTTLYAATHLGVYRSTDSGNNWERFGAWMPLVNVMEVQVADNGNSARAATYGRGLWEMRDITNNAVPVANFTTQTSGLTATFNNTSTDSDGQIVRSIWNFGDGISSSMNSPNHTYAQPGTYTVTLTVTDNGGLSHTRTAQVTVSNPVNANPVANFTFTTTNLSATFTDSSSDSDGTIASRSWNFGDGTTSTQANPVKTYAAAGTYNVSLTVTDNAGATHSVTRAVTVTAPANVLPVANFTSTVNGLTASFTDTSTDSDGSIASRAWDFGDGGTSTLANPSRTYAAAGTYNVRLTVTDNQGGTHSVTRAVTVTATAPPAGNTLTNGVAVTGITLAKDASRTWTLTVPAGATNLRFVTSGGTGDADLFVRFGSAPTTSLNDCKSEGGTSAETCNIATAQAGTYHVMVLAYSAISNVSLTGSFTAGTQQNVAPVAGFNATPNGLTVNFTDTSTDSDGSIASRAWNFGDGTTSTQANPSKTYATAGTYTVTLTVTDNRGATHSTSRQVTVAAPAGTPQTYSNTTAVAIPDNNQTGISSTIAVANRPGNAPTNASVSVDITHTWRGDLQIDLVAPDGTVYTLKSTSSADSGQNVSATYTTNLSSEALNGTWTLRVSDRAARDTGTLNRWSITF